MFVDLKGKTRIKLSLHTPMGKRSTDEVIEDCIEHGFDAVALTSPWEYQDGKNPYSIKVLSGCEYSVGELSEEYEAFHIVGVGMTSDPEVPSAWRDMKKTAKQKLSEIIKMIKIFTRYIMASSKKYLEFILEQLSGLEEITYRAMMGEYILYYRGKIIGGIYDDRLLVKPVKSAVAFMPDATFELPYEGAKEMLLVDDVDNRDFLAKLFNAMYDELPLPKKKR